MYPQQNLLNPMVTTFFLFCEVTFDSFPFFENQKDARIDTYFFWVYLAVIPTEAKFTHITAGWQKKRQTDSQQSMLIQIVDRIQISSEQNTAVYTNHTTIIMRVRTPVCVCMYTCMCVSMCY